jgi:cellulose synthase operon protein C
MMCVRFLALALTVGLLATPAYAADRAEAEKLLVKAVNSYRAGEVGAARTMLLNAAKEDPKWPVPLAVQASIQLATGDGFGGEASANRALELGIKPAEINQLLAHAYLLQGDAQRALDFATDEEVAPRFAGYAARIRALAAWRLEDFETAGTSFDEAIRINPKSAATWTDIARYRESVANLSGAIDAAARALELDPKKVSAVQQMGALVRNQYGLTAAIPWFRRALDLDPQNLDVMRELAATLGDAGQTIEMLQVTRDMLEIDPANAQAFYLQAVLAARAKKYELARSLLYRVGDRLSGVPGVKLLKASVELQGGSSEQAIALLQEIVKDQPGNLKAQRLLGAALWKAGDAKSTINILGQLANRPDADSYTLSVIGRAYEEEGDRGRAAAYLARAASPVRGDAMPFDMAGDLQRLAKASVGPSMNAEFAVPYINRLVLAGRTSEALNLAIRLRAQNPGAAAAHVLVGDTLAAMGKTADAAAAYKDAAAIRFNEPVALRLIESLERSGQNAAALRVLDLFLSQNPQSVPGLLLAADHFMVSGQWDRSIEILEGLRFRLGNRDATVLNSLGWAWFNKGNAAKAAEYSGAAYGMVPSNPAFADTYGWILYKSRRNKEGGAALLEKAVATAPDHPGLRYHLGQALAGVGRKAEAKVHLRMAASQPDFPDAKAAAKLLAGL